MEENKRKVLELVHLDSEFRSLICDESIEIPYLDFAYSRNFGNEFQYPPFFLPFFARYEGPLMHGFILHPFSSTRSPSIGNFGLESNKVTEIARTGKQYVTQMVVDMLCVSETLDEEISEFLSKVQYSKDNIGEVKDFALSSDGAYDSLVYFRNNLPLQLISDFSEYRGSFVSSSKRILNREMIKASSVFEMYYLDEWTPSLQTNAELPSWMVASADLRELFHSYLDSGELEKAWFTLNNDQWELSEINDGLKKLQSISDNHLFQLLANSWRSHFGFL